MKTFLLPAVSVMGMLLAAGTAYPRPSFYYAFSEKTPIHPNPNKVFVKYRGNSDNPTALVESVKSRIQSKKGRILSLRKTAPFAGILSSQGGFTPEEFAAIASMDGVEAAMEVLETGEGTEMSYQDHICFKFKPGISRAEARRIAAGFGIDLVQETTFLVGKVRAGEDALEVANRLYETGNLEYSHPDFHVPFVLNQVPNDTYFNWQWNLRNTGQTINDGHVGTAGADIRAVDAWRTARGRNVTVAVLDQGVTANHPDLANTRQLRLNGSNFSGGNVNDPSPTGSENHGNACAGLVGAEINNGVGIAGIAPGVTIMPIRMLGNATNAAVANAIDFARNNGAQVLSNSWGYSSTNPNFVPAIVDAINRALTLGRNGRGCIVVFAAGNTANHAGGNAGFIGFPANVAGVITVGASDRNDRQANYSPTSPTTGKTIDLVAPSHRAYATQITGEDLEVWTMDIPGNLGYNPNQNNGAQLPANGSSATWDAFTGRMGGTSAACPQVAGVAAILLGIKPGLRAQEVLNILTTTADRVGGYTYTAGRSRELGFGRLNAVRAARLALPLTTLTRAR